jgi:hypothetical protein
MLALLSGRFRRLIFFMIAVPIGGRVLESAGRRIESRRGPTRLSRALRAGGSTANRFSRGPLRPRAEAAARAAEQQYAATPGSGVNGHGAAANQGQPQQKGRRGRRGRAGR